MPYEEIVAKLYVPDVLDTEMASIGGEYIVEMSAPDGNVYPESFAYEPLDHGAYRVEISAPDGNVYPDDIIYILMTYILYIVKVVVQPL